MKPLRIVAANDAVQALLAMGNVLDGSEALFISPPEVNGLMPVVHGLSNEVEGHVGLIVESSGSTGTPKRLELSAKALTAAAKMTSCQPQKVKAASGAMNSRTWLVRCTT